VIQKLVASKEKSASLEGMLSKYTSIDKINQLLIINSDKRVPCPSSRGYICQHQLGDRY